MNFTVQIQKYFLPCPHLRSEVLRGNGGDLVGMKVRNKNSVQNTESLVTLFFKMKCYCSFRLIKSDAHLKTSSITDRKIWPWKTF